MGGPRRPSGTSAEPRLAATMTSAASASTGMGRGWRVGHWTDSEAATGCTVLLPPPGNVTSCDVRGSSPSSRELELLHPDPKLTEVHGIVLTGGSALRPP